MKEDIMNLLPSQIKNILREIPPHIQEQIEEIRIREKRPLEINYSQKYTFLTSEGKMTLNSGLAYHPTSEDMHKMMNLISNHSIYRLEEELRRGYITVRGGHRVGITGEVILEKGEVKAVTNISGYNFRIAKEVIGASDPILPYIINLKEMKVHNTLIVSPPQCGKTTMLRDIARQISSGFSRFNGKKVGIIDERSEIAGCVRGIPQHQVGTRTDVLDACPKAEGMMMMIRSMSPEVLIVDEIGRHEDAVSIMEARNAGVQIIATVHGSNMSEITRRPSISGLIQQGVFTRYIFLSGKKGAGTIEQILDEQLNPVRMKEILHA